jgi:hypothetical protein
MASCAGFVAQALGLPASSIAASANSVSLQYSPFSISADGGGGAASGAGASTTTLTPGGIVGAAIGGIVVALALAVGVWARRSYAKHGKLPWQRNRKLELFARKSREAEVYEVESALAEAEKALEARDAEAAAKFGGGAAAPKAKGKGKSKRDVIKQLVEKEAEAKRAAEEARREKDAEVAALRAQLKEAKQVDENDEEVAALKRQLAEAKAWQSQMQAWAAAQQAAPAAEPQLAQRAAFEPSQQAQ